MFFSHGTRCAGEVAAARDNGVCGVGVAYDSKIAGEHLFTLKKPQVSHGRIGFLVWDVSSHLMNFKQINEMVSWLPEDDECTAIKKFQNQFNFY